MIAEAKLMLWWNWKTGYQYMWNYIIRTKLWSTFFTEVFPLHQSSIMKPLTSPSLVCKIFLLLLLKTCIKFKSCIEINDKSSHLICFCEGCHKMEIIKTNLLKSIFSALKTEKDITYLAGCFLPLLSPSYILRFFKSTCKHTELCVKCVLQSL